MIFSVKKKHSSAFCLTVFVLSLQLKSFHNELLSELEKKVELDARYLTVSIRLVQKKKKSAHFSLLFCAAFMLHQICDGLI